MKLQFVNVSSHEMSRTSGTRAQANDDERRRRIRTHVMQDFRRKERLLNTHLNDPAPQEPMDRMIQAMHLSARTPPSIPSPQMWRSSFAHVLVDGWFPSNMGYVPRLKDNIAYTYTAHGSTPVIAIHDALSILHVGSITGNEGLLLEARKRYVVAVNGLRVNAEQAGPTIPLAKILVVAMGVLMSEMYSAISVPMAWQRHITGMSALLSTYQSQKQDSPLEDYLLQQVWAAQLVHSLCTRKPFHSALAVPKVPSKSSRVDKLLYLASKAPQLLQNSDGNPDVEDHEARTALFKMLLDHRDALIHWLSAFQASNNRDGVTWNECGNELGHPTRPQKPESLLCELTCESLCCICLLLLSECIHGMQSSPRSVDSALLDLQRYAEFLKNTTSLLAKAAIIPICAARAISGPLFFLTRIYARIGDVDGLRWCKQIQETWREQAPYLRWDALLPWSLITLYDIPQYDARLSP